MSSASDHTSSSLSLSGGHTRTFPSSGRGGMGNIRRSASTLGFVEQVVDGPADYVRPTHGREAISNPTKNFSSGRGGSGNIRRPSMRVTIPKNEQDLIRRSVIFDSSKVHSSGRGGLGNIHRLKDTVRGLSFARLWLKKPQSSQ